MLQPVILSLQRFHLSFECRHCLRQSQSLSYLLLWWKDRYTLHCTSTYKHWIWLHSITKQFLIWRCRGAPSRCCYQTVQKACRELLDALQEQPTARICSISWDMQWCRLTFGDALSLLCSFSASRSRPWTEERNLLFSDSVTRYSFTLLLNSPVKLQPWISTTIQLLYQPNGCRACTALMKAPLGKDILVSMCILQSNQKNLSLVQSFGNLDSAFQADDVKKRV